MYANAGKLKDPSITIKPYIPFKAFDRKVALDKLLERRRKSTPNLKTNVRLGNQDFYVMEKTVIPYDYQPWKVVDLTIIDPENTLPPIKGGRIPDHEVEAFVKEAARRMERTAIKENSENRDENKKRKEVLQEVQI